MNYEKALRELFYMQQVYATLFSVSNKIQTAGDKALGNLSSKQYMTILGILHLPDGEASLNNIAKKLGTTKQNVRQLVNALEKKGYVEVLSNKKDKRAVNVEVTESGLGEMVRSSDFGNLFMADLFEEFSEEELKVLWSLLQKLHRFDGQAQDGFEAEPAIAYEISDAQKERVLQQFINKRKYKPE